MLPEFTRSPYSRNTYGYPAYRLTPVIGGEEASMAAKKPVHLGVLGLAPGAHQAAWRHPNWDPRGHAHPQFLPAAGRTRGPSQVRLLIPGRPGGAHRRRPEHSGCLRAHTVRPARADDVVSLWFPSHRR